MCFYIMYPIINQNFYHLLILMKTYEDYLLLRVLFENRPALYFCNYKEKNNTRILDTSFIYDFIDIVKPYFHYWNHNWQCKNLNRTEEI